MYTFFTHNGFPDAPADPLCPSDTANFAPSGPSPMDSPVRKLPSVKHAPVTVAILPEGAKFTYSLTGHSGPAGADREADR